MAVSGCGGASGPPTLTWYINPDNGGQATRAQQCADASGGAYTVDIQTLPSDATQQREQLVRRLAAKDSSIDVMSLDVIYTAEFANAGFLRPYTPAETARISEGKLPAPLKTGMWKDTLYAAPSKSNAQLLWFRKSLAKAAGVDPTSPTFTWDEMIKAALGQGKKISEQGARYEGYMVWINALVLSGGGQIPPTPRPVRTPGRAWPAGPGTRPRGDRRQPCAVLGGGTGLDCRAGGAGPRGVPRRRRHVYVELALRSRRRAFGRRGGHAGPVGGRRHRLRALPAGLRGQTQRATARRINLAIGAYSKYPEQAAGWSSARRRWRR